MLSEEAVELNQHIRYLPERGTLEKQLFVDTFRHPYVKFKESFHWPSITTTELQRDEVERILEIIIPRIPEFIRGTSIMAQSRPTRHSNQLHFIREFQVDTQKYAYHFRISAEYMGGAETDEVRVPHAQGRSPEVKTDRIYFSSRIIPVTFIRKFQGSPIDFEPFQVKDAIFKIYPEDMEREFTSTILFDEVDFTEVNKRFTELYSYHNAQWKPGRLFNPFVIDHLTLTLNLIYPDYRVLDKILVPFHKVFRSFIEDDPSIVSEDTMEFWEQYYEVWEYERVNSRSGNPHWIFNKYYNVNDE